ncbi:MAG: hypothetical protein JNK82_26035 [Myxococcaceae bacterium]|nr:hypothetical protein [Myxococcaceae bacterium]
MVRSFFLLALSGCATAQIIGPPIVTTPDDRVTRVVVIEPFFETADWQTEVLHVTSSSSMPMSGFGGTGMGVGVGVGMGSGMRGSMMGPASQTTEVTRTVKPLLAQIPSLTAEHRLVLEHVQRLRPGWRVSSTSGLSALEGNVTVVRTIIESNQIIETDRPLKNAAFAFGLLLLPLQIYNFWPVTETERAYGSLERYLTDAPTVKQRLVRYKTQPDSAFNAAGFSPLKRQFGLEMTYEEGLLADENPRKQALIEAFSERLASAIVAIVEEP